MGRYSKLGSDEEHLPDGFERVGYDADTGRYTFRDRNDGSLWQGPEGASYGQLTRIGQSNLTNEEHDRNTQAWIATDKRESWRMFAPWLLLVVLFLLIVGWIISPSSPIKCTGDTSPYRILPGDTCWEIASKASVDVQELQAANLKLDCDRLVPGKQLCVPIYRGDQND